MADENTPDTPPSYDDDLFADVQAAVTESTSKAAETPAEAPSTEPAAKPAEAPSEPKADRDPLRDDQGRFKAKAADEPKPAEAKPTPAPAQAAPTAAPAPAAAKPMTGPPKGWSSKAISQWDRLPEVVREEINKAADPAYGDLRGYAEQARAQGQNLEQVMASYVGIENLIRSNPMQGFSRVAANIGMTPHQMGQFFAQLAAAHGYMPQPQTNGQTYSPPVDPNAAAQAEQPDLGQLLAPVVSPLQQRLDQLEQRYIQQAEAERGQRLQGATSVIEKFRQDPKHRYYDNVESKVGDLLEKGVVPRTGDFHADLAAAYDMACRLDPEVSEILANERLESLQAEKDKAAREAADRARSASRSVTGSPSSGAGQPAAKRDPRVSYDDDLHNDVVAAMRESMGRA